MNLRHHHKNPWKKIGRNLKKVTKTGLKIADQNSLLIGAVAGPEAVVAIKAGNAAAKQWNL